MMDFATIWFFIILLLFIVYSVLDGFDLGVGILLLFTKSEEKKSQLLASIAPFGNGNELWLIFAGGSLFAVFSRAFTTVLSGFYLPVIAVMAALIVRAASGEFREHAKSALLIKTNDILFGFSSMTIVAILSIALGNVVTGIPLNAQYLFTGKLSSLFSPYPVLLAVLSIFLVMLQGALFAAMKIPAFTGSLLATAKQAWGGAMAGTILLLAAAFIYVKTAIARPSFWIAAAGLTIVISVTRYFITRRKPAMAFAAASVSIAGVWVMQAALLFPALLRNSINPNYSITIFNSAGDPATLRILTFAAPPMVIVFAALSIWLFAIFRGKKNPTGKN